MKEKAKSDARKVASAVKNVAHKVGVSLSGKAYVYPERMMYENIQYLAWAIENRGSLIERGQHTEKELRLLYDEAAKWAHDSLAGAIIDNDVGFFERMADLARLGMQGGLVQSGKTIDEKSAHVGLAVLALRREKKSITGESVAVYLNVRWPKPKRAGKIIKGDKTPIMEGAEWDGGEVRKIMRKIGIKAGTKKRLVS
jgi:hypothetical protein